jgi:ABC-type branched-subunit amino acid transport system ATPase component
MSVVGGISDRVIALDHGVKIAEDDFERVTQTAEVIEAYLGRTTHEMSVLDATDEQI